MNVSLQMLVCHEMIYKTVLTSLLLACEQALVCYIKEMSKPNHKLHSLLPKKICEVRKRTTRLNNQMYYNFMGKTERFKSSPISYAVSKYNETLFG